VASPTDKVAESGGLGVIRIRTREDGDDVVVNVSDDGCGIPDGIQDRIFEQFFTTKEAGRGTGQGLALARSVVVDHDGSLTVDSTAGEGTTFTLRLPVGGARTGGPTAGTDQAG
jgi:signal transduction histidine kinase